MQFEYLYQVQATGFVDIENIGEVCLQGTDDIGREYILIIHTEDGQSKIIQFGPIFVETGAPLFDCYCSYLSIQYNQGKLIKTIEKFLCNPKSAITQVIEITLDEARNKIKNLVDFL